MKPIRTILSMFLVLAVLASMVPAYAAEREAAPAEVTMDSAEALPASGNERSVKKVIYVDDDPEGGYKGDYVVIYNPSTNANTAYSTGDMSGRINKTIVSPNVGTGAQQPAEIDEVRPYIIDVDSMLAEEVSEGKPEQPAATRESFTVGSKKTFTIYKTLSPTGDSSVEFKCLYVGEHCYIWTPTSTNSNIYPLDSIDSTYAQKAAQEFDSKYSLMQSSFGDHYNGTQGDGKIHVMFYNLNDGWQPGNGYVGGFFWGGDFNNNGLPMLNIDTYPGVLYPTSSGTGKDISKTYNTMVHEYQHLINYSNTRNMNTWLNESFSAAAEEICYPGSSVVSRIQSWENYSYSRNNTWLNPPAEFTYQSDYTLHNGYSLYRWDDNLSDVLALYAQVSFFAQYLYTRFDNSIYRQISQKWSYNKEIDAITNATGINCSDLARDFRIAVTANAALNQCHGIYSFKTQNGYDPSQYHNVQSPWNLLAPIVFTGASCSIQGGGAITVKPVNGVYNPPADADSNLEYYGISYTTPYTVTAVAEPKLPIGAPWGTVSVDGYTITATPSLGYYARSYEVKSGTATVTKDGNLFYVNPSSNCIIAIVFFPKITSKVQFKACGEIVDSQSVQAGSVIDLPESVNTSIDGWTFCGWTRLDYPNDVMEVTEFYEPGSAYEVIDFIVTFNAVYTRREENALYYKLVDTEPADWTGNYVISYGTDSDMYLMKGVTVSENGNNLESTKTADLLTETDACLLSDSFLRNVINTYVFELGSNDDGYPVRSSSTGIYLGMSSDGHLSGFKNFDTTWCRWIPGSYDGISGMENALPSGMHYLDFFHNTRHFVCFSSTSPEIRFWKETIGPLTYYSTAPVTPHVHNAQCVTATAPTCGAVGNVKYYHCSDCGKCFSDQACLHWITQESTVIPATGNHNLGSWVPNNDGTHTGTCSVCGTQEIVDCTYQTTVTEPTCLDDGYTTYHCTVCGETHTGDETDALGHDYAVAIAPPSCTVGGYTIHTCTRCNYSYTDEETSPTGHEWLKGDVKEPTCTERGYTTYTCGFCCDTKQDDYTDPLGHDYQAVVTEPTCAAGGYTTHTCSRCKDSYTDSETQALGHGWDEGTVTKEPKYRLPGEKTFTCTRCSATKTEEIARLANPFEDVHEDDFFFNPVMWALDETITAGVDDTHFAPGNTVLRSDSMVFFWAAKGRPAFTSTSKTFRDVKKKHWAYPAVMWAVENGITGGTDAAGLYFSPSRTCTRCEILQFLYAAMEKPAYTIANPYSDVKNKHWYKDGAIWAYENGLEKGENGKFNAMTPCTRGYVVTYLFRFMTGEELAK